MSTADDGEQLVQLCAAMLHEIGGYAITTERIRLALPLIRGTLAEIRRLDALELDAIEPAVIFRPEP